jgi:hypothetical protein
MYENQLAEKIYMLFLAIVMMCSLMRSSSKQ